MRFLGMFTFWLALAAWLALIIVSVGFLLTLGALGAMRALRLL